MFGRKGRRRRGAGKHAGSSLGEDLAGPPLETGDQEPAADPPVGRPMGPWDGDEQAPETPRVDLGAMRVPVGQGLEVQLNMMEEDVVAATVSFRGSTLQLQAFAAPKSEELWPEARREIAEELAQGEGTVTEVDGPFGDELRSVVRLPAPDGSVVTQPARFVGVDGPRWLLRGAFTGEAGAADQATGNADGLETTRVLEEVFRGVVVVRGDEPLPPRERLRLKVPPEARSTGPSPRNGTVESE